MPVDLFLRLSSGRLVLLSLAVFCFFLVIVLPDQAQKSSAAAPEAGSPDLSLYYTADGLYQMADAYGEQGRKQYIRARLTFDVIWPLVYGSFLVTTLSWLTVRTFSSNPSGWRSLIYLPLMGVLFDFTENALTSIVMARYPRQTPLLAELSGPATLIKWILVYSSFVVLLLLLAYWLWRQLNDWRQRLH